MTPSTQTPATTARRPLSFVLFILGLLVLTVAACRRCSPASSPSTPADELAQLRADIDRATDILAFARIGCEMLSTEQDKATCHGTVDAAQDTLEIASQLVVSGQACQASGDLACAAESIETARRIDPELRQLADRVGRLVSGAVPPDEPEGSGGASAPSSGASGAGQGGR